MPFLIFLAGCASAMPERAQLPSDVRMIPDVPLYADSGNQCGPASLAAVLDYWHAKRPSLATATPEEISSEIYSRGARGTLGTDLEFYAKEKGLQARQSSGSLDDIRHNIANEIPLIILVDYGFSLYQRNHFVVVTGYGRDWITAHSGHNVINVPFEELEKIWQKTNYWMLVIRPPD
ncbi:MAG: C39 family peptidase [Nitrospirae bacterium]|nr:C39 family peptidase [Nitrospirota bacterium]